MSMENINFRSSQQCFVKYFHSLFLCGIWVSLAKNTVLLIRQPISDLIQWIRFPRIMEMSVLVKSGKGMNSSFYVSIMAIICIFCCVAICGCLKHIYIVRLYLNGFSVCCVVFDTKHIINILGRWIVQKRRIKRLFSGAKWVRTPSITFLVTNYHTLLTQNTHTRKICIKLWFKLHISIVSMKILCEPYFVHIE